MNKHTLEGNWDQLRGKIKQVWGKLTDDDIALIKGKKEELTGRIKERYGYEKDKIDEEIKRFYKDNDLE